MSHEVKHLTPALVRELREKAEKKLGRYLKELLQNLYIESMLRDDESRRLLNFTPRLVVEPSITCPRLDDIRPEEFGVCTFEPSINGDMDFEQREIFIPSQEEMKDFEHQPFFVVLAEVYKRYGKDYDFPGIEYMQWLCDRPEHVPPSMKHKDFCIFIGSRFRSIEGEWWYFDVQWTGKELEQWHAEGLYRRWSPADKIVLLKKRTIN